MNRPRVLIFSLAYEPLASGAELAVRYITDRLFDYEFELITCRFSRQDAAREKIGNVTVYRVGFGSRLGRYLYPAFAYWLARKLHRVRQYHVAWSIMAAYAAGAALMFVRSFPQVKYLLTLQEGDPVEHIHGRVRGFKKLWQQAFRRADHISAISNFLAQWARAEGATCPVEVVPNGVDVEKFTPHPTLSPEGRGIKGEGSKIITTSRLVPKNGIDTLIRAATVLNSPFTIQILGGGPDERKLKKLARELDVEKEVQFLGNVDNSLVPGHLAAAEIFVRPSRSEGQGISFLEAMAAGLPIIATPVGGIPEFLKEGKNGLFCKVDDPEDLADKMKLLLEDDNLRRQLGNNGQKLVREHYSWDYISAQMDKIFRKLI